MPRVTDEFIDRVAELEDIARLIPILAKRTETLERTLKTTQMLLAVVVENLICADMGKVMATDKIMQSWKKNNPKLRNAVDKMVKRWNDTGSTAYTVDD